LKGKQANRRSQDLKVEVEVLKTDVKGRPRENPQPGPGGGKQKTLWTEK